MPGLALLNLRLRFDQFYGLPLPMDPSPLGTLIAEEPETWRRMVEFAGVSVE